MDTANSAHRDTANDFRIRCRRHMKRIRFDMRGIPREWLYRTMPPNK
jgi:hypothetical protein